jgi:hypothetical protein
MMLAKRSFIAKKFEKSEFPAGIYTNVLDQPHFAVQESYTRLVYPFTFQRRQTEALVEHLLEQTFLGHCIWEALDAEALQAGEASRDGNKSKGEYYRTETHEAALNSIFGRGSPGGSEVTDRRYVRMQPSVANSMFPRHMAMWNNDRFFPFQFTQPLPVEIFLSPFGVGALNFTVELDCRPLLDRPSSMQIFMSEQYVVMFNYRLSQLHGWAAPALRIAHPSDDQEKWNNIPDHLKANIPEAPDQDAPFLQRLNAPGGVYQLPELIEFLLKPVLKDREISVEDNLEFAAKHKPLSVYSVVRFGPEVDFTNDDSGTLGRMLSALAQIEEHSHAGSVPGKVPIPNELLNKNHWAAVSALGAAHLLSDQSDDLPFNVERARRARDRYFLAYMAAFLQKHTIRNAGDRVGRAMAAAAERKPGKECHEDPNLAACAEFNVVAKDMIEFNAVAYLPEISHREAINRYYRLAQDGMQLSQTWLRTNESIATLDKVCRNANEEAVLQNQTALLNSQRDLLGESVSLQAKVEWVEVLIVGLYIAELVHALGENFEFVHPYRGVLALTFSVAAMVLTYRLLEPEEHVELPRLKWALVTTGLGLVLFLILGWRFFLEESHFVWTTQKLLIASGGIVYIVVVLLLFRKSKAHRPHNRKI